MRAISRASPAILTAASLLGFLGCETTKRTQQATVATFAWPTNTGEASKREEAALPAAQFAPGSQRDYAKQKAEAGDANAQMLLAQMYDEGKGVKQSDAEG